MQQKRSSTDLAQGKLQTLKRLSIFGKWGFLHHDFSLVFESDNPSSEVYRTLSTVYLKNHSLKFYHRWCIHILIVLRRPPRAIGHYVAAMLLGQVLIVPLESRYLKTVTQVDGRRQRHLIKVRCAARDMQYLCEDNGEESLVCDFSIQKPETTEQVRTKPSKDDIALSFMTEALPQLVR